MDEEPEQAAKGRRWKVSLGLVGLGLGVLIYGLIARYVPAMATGALLIIVFGCVAAGARKVSVGTELIHADVEFDPPPLPQERKRLYLPGRIKRKR